MTGRFRLLPALGLISLLLPAHNAAAEGAPDSAAVKFFEDRVRPVLAEHCFACHGPAKQKGGLRLDSRAAAIKGGDIGPAVVPGETSTGLLIKAVGHAGELKMPPTGKLAPRQIADLTAWVNMGAPWPADAVAVGPVKKTPTAGGEHWSFLPVREPAPPAVADEAWVRNPIDRFVLAKLAEKNLKPAPPADKRTLIRRATFDLLGLPPTPEETEAFVRDESPAAFAKLVDRLLASPQYGERWGRHWLDVARYADSNGMDENLSYANAWRYRDWVIGAFNADLPFDRFVKLQLAGDLLVPDSPEGVVPTGFLMIGPKMLAEDDPVKMQMDIIDEQLDTLGQAFLGLTLGCARCHDHKFDPVTARDYYALAGILKSTKTMDNFSVVARWQERPLGDPAALAKAKAHDELVAAAKKDLKTREGEAKTKLLADARARVADYLAAAEEVRKNRSAGAGPRMAGGKPPVGTMSLEAEDFQRGNVLKDRENYGKGIGVLVNAGPLPNFTEYDVTVPADGSYALEFRYAAADPRPVRVLLDGKYLEDATGRVTGGWGPDKQEWDGGPAVTLKKGKAVIRLERAGPVPHIDKLALVPLPAGQAAPVRPTDRQLVPVFLKQLVAHLDRLGKAPEGDALKKLAEANDGPFAVPTPIDPLLSAEVAAELKMLREKVTTLEKARPPLPTAMAVSEGKPENLKIHLRGSHLTLGAEALRGFPAALTLPGQPAVGLTGSGRKELAEWVTRADHPLTARVAVNRLWTWHFGDGLVHTPDNFGRLGDTPVHRELLDWLAARFVKEGWSVKAMHRLVMASATYQMSAAYDPAAALNDPENRLHGHWPRQRLGAEAFRDALLAVGGNLDLTPGGSLLTVPNRAYVTSTANRNYDGYDSDRRSVYLPVVRSAGYEPFQAFDFPDPSVPKGRRAVTNVPAQSLLLMNGKLVGQQMRRLADRLLARPGDDAARVRFAYELVFSRPATTVETNRALEFVGQYEKAAVAEKIPAPDARRRAWQGLCRALVSSNEFMYVE